MKLEAVSHWTARNWQWVISVYAGLYEKEVKVRSVICDYLHVNNLWGAIFVKCGKNSSKTNWNSDSVEQDIRIRDWKEAIVANIQF